MKKIIAISALMASLASANALAVDSNLTFTGSVTSGTCTLNAADTTKTLTIPDIGVQALLANGNTWAYQNGTASINFTSCPSSVSAVKIVKATTTGKEALAGNVHNYLPASGSAQNIILVLSAGTPTGLVSTDGSVIDNSFATTSTGTATIPVYVGVRSLKSLVSSSSDPTPGNYSSAYTLTFSWS